VKRIPKALFVPKEELHLEFAVACVDARPEVVRDDQVRWDLGPGEGNASEHGMGPTAAPGLVTGAEADRIRRRRSVRQGQSDTR